MLAHFQDEAHRLHEQVQAQEREVRPFVIPKSDTDSDTSSRSRHSNSRRRWKRKNFTTKSPALNRWPRALRPVPQFPAHSPPYQFNRCHTFDLSCLLLSSKAMSVERRTLIFPTRARTHLRRVILICSSIPCVDLSCCFDCSSSPPHLPPSPPRFVRYAPLCHEKWCFVLIVVE